MKGLNVILLFIFLGMSAALSNDKLLIVSFDGFRYDYIDKTNTPFLYSLSSRSVQAKVVMNVFPTVTFPNHFSIATGLYVESHGVIANTYFNKTLNKLINYSYDLFHYGPAVPIWALNEKMGGISGVCMWAGCDYEYNEINPTYKMVYNYSISFEDRVSTIIEWLTNPLKPANLVLAYFEEPDKHEHAFGPESPQVVKQIKRVDTVAQLIMEKIDSGINVIFLSDHGMEQVTKDRIIDLESVIGSKAQKYGTSPVLQIYPNSGNENEVYAALKNFSTVNGHFKVFKKEDIPERFHYKNCLRAPPILALADPKYVFDDFTKAIEYSMKKYNISDNGVFGCHGYDPETVNMHPYFIAIGPMFKAGFVKPEIKVVDMFSVFAHILGIDPSNSKTNGSLINVWDIFNSAPARSFSPGLYYIPFLLVYAFL